MKKTTKKHSTKASRQKAVKNLDVKPGKSGTVRGGSGGDRPTESVTLNPRTS